jgi:hypothetical protein
MIDRVDRRKAITNDKQSRTSAASMEGKVRGACLLLNPRATPEGARGERWGDCRNQNHNPFGFCLVANCSFAPLQLLVALVGLQRNRRLLQQRVINTGCSMEAVSRSSPMSTPFRMSTPREFLHTETPSHSSSFLRNEGVAALRVHARLSLRSTSRCRWCWTPTSTASGSTRPTLHRTSAPTLHRRVPRSLSRPTPPPSSWPLSQRRTHLRLSRSGVNWASIRLSPLPSSHAALPPWNWRRPILSPPARSLQSSILGGLSYLCCHGHRG